MARRMACGALVLFVLAGVANAGKPHTSAAPSCPYAPTCWQPGSPGVYAVAAWQPGQCVYATTRWTPAPPQPPCPRCHTMCASETIAPSVEPAAELLPMPHEAPN